MTYNKPTVHVLGDAVAVITDINNNPKRTSTTDGPVGGHSQPAYDLDE